MIFSLLVLIDKYGISPESFMKNEKDYVDTSGGPNCENLSFQDTAICLNDYVRKIFIYNFTDDSLQLSLEDLKTRGGDCKDWTDFYDKYMNYYGYPNTQKVQMFVNEEKMNETTVRSYHVFLVATDVSGYCDMDMKELQCFQFTNNKGQVKE